MNTHYVLARLVVEKATGRPFADELRQLIPAPLGMTGTVAPGASPEISEPHDHGYCRSEDDERERAVDVTRRNPSRVGAGGDMISTTRDLHTYFSALNDGRLLPAGRRTRAGASARYELIGNHREGRVPVAARLTALTEAGLRSAGVPLPRR
ncbi:serine hydrolase [Streptomyces sp. NPDC093089]|uniref:serine hydrolase n=1 Tax=Streptomyces sp. NPDC093089 TaxID=3366024 RepID=UPI0037FACAD2